MADYYFSDGNLTFTGTGTNDTLNFNDDTGGSFDWRNFSFYEDGDDNLVIDSNDGNITTLEDHFLNNTTRFETLTFDDGFTIDLSSSNVFYTTVDLNPNGSFASSVTAYGTSSSDVLLIGLGEDVYSYLLSIGGSGVNSGATYAAAGAGDDIIIATTPTMFLETMATIHFTHVLTLAMAVQAMIYFTSQR